MRVFGFIRKGIEVYVPVDFVKGIYQDETVFMYPELSDRLNGLVFMNGEVIPVIDIYRVIKGDFTFMPVDSYKNRSSFILIESKNSVISLLYDSLKDIVEREYIKDVVRLDKENMRNSRDRGAFFVENIELLEDIIPRVKSDRNRFQEIFLCPKKS